MSITMHDSMNKKKRYIFIKTLLSTLLFMFQFYVQHFDILNSVRFSSGISHSNGAK